MEQTTWINYGKTELPIDVSAVEKKKNAKYIGDFAVYGKYGWTESPAQIYFQETPPNPSFSNYFGLVFQGDTLYITSGASIAGIPIYGVQTAAGEIIYSRYRWDYRVAETDNSVFIDGGRDYVKRGSTGKGVVLTLRGPELVLVEDAQEIESLQAELDRRVNVRITAQQEEDARFLRSFLK